MIFAIRAHIAYMNYTKKLRILLSSTLFVTIVTHYDIVVTYYDTLAQSGIKQHIAY